MTPEEVFAKLRDIHLPEKGAIVQSSLDLRPIIAFVLLIAALLVFRFLQTQWRTRAALSRIDGDAPPSDQRDALVRLLSISRKRQPVDVPPAVLFDPPEAVAVEEVAKLRRWVARRLG